MSVLTVKDARIKFGGYEALKGISLSVKQGELVTLLGPSGCGKTTLLRSIAGFTPLNSGTIEIDGQDMHNVPPERRDTAMCFQSYALFPHLSVFENIAFGLRQKGTPKKEINERVRASAAQVSLDSQLEKLPGQLSGGQQQRVALARALAVRPGIILFDEPLSNLDARLRDQVRFEIRQLQRTHGFTAVYVTHDQAEALAMSDLVVVMNGGKIEQAGTPYEVYYKPINRFVADFVGTANIMAVRVLNRSVSENTYRVSSPIGELTVTSDEAPIGDTVYAMWRPEDAKVGAGTLPMDATNVVTFKVEAESFLGNLTDLTVRPTNSERSYRIQTLGRASIRENGEGTFSLEPGQIRFLREVAA
ncbi:ABC transporter ATP-binding protein [Agrobacterium tumefaciens]|uniref:ABC transporter ATP-binding protein n=1 Tax=Agrobacterium tumefaciens TaxID=358 RepID=UPI00023A275E|nr:CysA2 [Agrobacterium tumefaciens 5A]